MPSRDRDSQLLIASALDAGTSQIVAMRRMVWWHELKGQE